MSAIMRTDKHPFAELGLDPQLYTQVGLRLVDIINRSFAEDRLRNPLAGSQTQSELKRRTKICLDWFLIFRRDMHFSVARSLDIMPRALRAKLDGLPWEPTETERSWGAPDRTKPMEVDQDDLIHDGKTVGVDEDGNKVLPKETQIVLPGDAGHRN